jgi:hypothetical protein
MISVASTDARQERKQAILVLLRPSVDHVHVERRNRCALHYPCQAAHKHDLYLGCQQAFEQGG